MAMVYAGRGKLDIVDHVEDLRTAFFADAKVKINRICQFVWEQFFKSEIQQSISIENYKTDIYYH